MMVRMMISDDCHHDDDVDDDHEDVDAQCFDNNVEQVHDND